MPIHQATWITWIKDREKIAKQIAKTSDLIRKKYRALKIGKIAEDIALERHFKPIVEPLKQIVENIEESQPIKKEANIAKDIDIKKKKREDSDDDDDNTTTNRDSYWTDVGWLKLTPPKKQRTKQLNATSDSFTYKSTSKELLPPKELSKEPSKIPSFVRNEDVFETKDVSELSPKIAIKQTLQMQRGSRKVLHGQLGPLG
ncbi:hypothetical protein P5V15_001205 [Pogonomyrmex californicus]